jgi:hypothetical protein
MCVVVIVLSLLGQKGATDGRSAESVAPAPGEATGVFWPPLTRLRTILRLCHLTTGMLLVAYVYSPLGDAAAFG